MASVVLTKEEIVAGKRKQQTNKRYEGSVKRFMDWVLLTKGVPLQSMELEHFDSVLCEFMVNNFNGERPSWSSCKSLFYGLCAQYPRLSQRRLLVESKELLDAWDKQRDKKELTPVPWLVLVLLARLAAEQGRGYEAVALIIMGHCWIRVDNVLTLRKKDVVGNLRFVNPKFPVMLLKLSKTKTAKNQSVEVEREDVADLIRAAANLVDQDDDPLLPEVTYSRLRTLFEELIEVFGWSRFGWTLHRIRAGGASEAALAGREITDIAVRGTWASLKSAVHYIDEAANMTVYHQIPLHWLQVAKFFDEDLRRIFQDL
jgi:hypothetical protein